LESALDSVDDNLFGLFQIPQTVAGSVHTGRREFCRVESGGVNWALQSSRNCSIIVVCGPDDGRASSHANSAVCECAFRNSDDDYRGYPTKCQETKPRIIIQIMHGREWTFIYDEPEVENVA